MVAGKYGASRGSSHQEANPGGGVALVLALPLLSQVALGKSLPLWALVSSSENRSG